MNRLKEIRQKEGLSQQALAKQIGVSYRTIQNWENGVNQLKPEKAQQLADYFGVSVGYLLGFTDINFKNISNDKSEENENNKALEGFDKLLLVSGFTSSDQLVSAIRKMFNTEKIVEKYKSEGITFSEKELENKANEEAEKQSKQILDEISRLSSAISYLDNSSSELLTIFYFLPDDEKEKLLEIAKVFYEKIK
ncbi:helix-turn-helix domain-containing protein [Streptococcus oralis]|uniref:helix-turn-helix domain-containing protein n=1 Tax=Streptococcus oralis TaxID=1303 RepID=UPI0018E137D2|nr:helix-turn-helix domain-containing protein [Streptococcus oralis]QQB99397.1 helix-turn-helix domain-containing protein [Streptococcus oralis]